MNQSFDNQTLALSIILFILLIIAGVSITQSQANKRRVVPTSFGQAERTAPQAGAFTSPDVTG
ncbi:MAG: hypothetical protein NWR72_08665 [Bacteroidia bacterium]|nr:hypothetical protein [Bacteroidia bacterium]